MICGDPGVGKSKVAQWLSLCLSLGLSFLGFKPCRPLKVLYIQAEEFPDDLTESLQGFHAAKAVNKVMTKTLDANWRIVSIIGLSGPEFVDVVAAQINEWHPDVIVTDPLLAFIGCDLVAQAEVTKFLRTSMNELITNHRVGWICTHHTSKASTRTGAGSKVNRALGSVEIAAYFRGVIDLALHPKDPRLVIADVTKRARQAQLKNPDGSPTRRVVYQVGDTTIGFEVVHEVSSAGTKGTSVIKSNGRPPKTDPKLVDEFIKKKAATGISAKEITGLLAKEFGYSAKQAGRLVKAAAATGKKEG